MANKLEKHKSALAEALSGHKTGLSAVAFGRGNLLASAGLDGKVKLWEWATNYPAIQFSEHDNWVTCMTMSPDSKKIYSGGKDKNIIIYDIDKQDIVNRLEKKITRNLSPLEWNNFMGDMPYQKIIPGLQ